jgi:hypothetical protein
VVIQFKARTYAIPIRNVEGERAALRQNYEAYQQNRQAQQDYYNKPVFWQQVSRGGGI